MQVSKLPQADRNPYPDCNFTAVIEIERINTGKGIPQKVVLVLPGFAGRKYAPEAELKVGDKVSASLVPFASMPEMVQQTQQADEVEDVDLTSYFAKDIKVIKSFTPGDSPVPFANSALPVKSAPVVAVVDSEAKKARHAQMQQDLEEIRLLLKKNGGDWDKWYGSLEPFRAAYQKQYEAKAQQWVGDSFFSAGYLDNSKIYSDDFVKSVIALKNYLAARNVDLILVRVPNKGEVDYDLFAPPPKDQVSNPYLLKLYKELLEADVEIVTGVIPKARESRLKYPLMYWYQDFEQNHPAEGVAWVIAEEVVKRLKRYSRIASAPPATFRTGTASTAEDWIHFRWPAGNAKFNSNDYVRFTTVLDGKREPVAIQKGDGSPILVLGSSFITAPSLAKGASIPSYLAYLTGVVPDMLQRRDGDFMMPRLIAQEGDAFLRNRVVCVFPFVPWVAHKSLAQLPVFDAQNSVKTQLAAYTGAELKILEAEGEQAPARFSFSNDGGLEVQPYDSKGDGAVRFRLKLPEAVKQYSHLAVSVKFSSKDFTGVKTVYGSQSDTIKRSGYATEELFGFNTTADRTVSFNILADKYKKVPAQVTEIKIYGVMRPLYYKTQK